MAGRVRTVVRCCDSLTGGLRSQLRSKDFAPAALRGGRPCGRMPLHPRQSCSNLASISHQSHINLALISRKISPFSRVRGRSPRTCDRRGRTRAEGVFVGTEAVLLLQLDGRAARGNACVLLMRSAACPRGACPRGARPRGACAWRAGGRAGGRGGGGGGRRAHQLLDKLDLPDMGRQASEANEGTLAMGGERWEANDEADGCGTSTRGGRVRRVDAKGQAAPQSSWDACNQCNRCNRPAETVGRVGRVEREARRT